ncbi:hypothetical protein [Salmonella phage SSBI34]|nr:hypothetical protein [Salmonella phage SSBI34]
MVFDWAKAGHKCFCFNAKEADHGLYDNVRVDHPNVTYVDAWIDIEWAENVESLGIPSPDIIFAFPPCTDMAVSGAAHFKRKAAKDPFFQINAVRTAKIPAYLAEFVFDCPYMIENPVSVLATKWRKSDHQFHPYEYGGYLPEDDVNPFFPEYIKARDAYPKKTCLWTGKGFNMPVKSPVSVPQGYSEQHLKLGGKSARTKLIRSLTPRGLAKAVFLHNS